MWKDKEHKDVELAKVLVHYLRDEEGQLHESKVETGTLYLEAELAESGLDQLNVLRGCKELLEDMKVCWSTKG